MKILLVAGTEHEFVAHYLLKDRKSVIVNKSEIGLYDALEHLREHPSPVDHIVVTDGGLSLAPDDNIQGLERLQEIRQAHISVVTRDFLFSTDLSGVSIIVTRWFRAVESDFRVITQKNAAHKAPESKTAARKTNDRKFASPRAPESETEYYEVVSKTAERNSTAQKSAVRTAWDADSEESNTAARMSPDMTAARNSTDKTAARKSPDNSAARHENNGGKLRKWGSKRISNEENASPAVSAASSKAILFTGHRGAGATSTCVNVAITASARGLNTMLVDLDTDYRATNLYFGEFYKQAEKDDYIASSLIRTLAQPQSYQTAAANIESNLWLTALGYGFSEDKLITQHYTETKIIGLITALKHSFNLVAIDLPLDALALFPGLLNSIDVFALCLENNIYSALTTLRNLSLGFDEQERVTYLASKSMLVVTKYNDESMYADEIITPERLSELIVSEELLEDFETEIPVAGCVPYVSWFGKQIEDDIPVMYIDSQMQMAYDEILLRLFGVAK